MGKCGLRERDGDTNGMNLGRRKWGGKVRCDNMLIRHDNT